MLRGYGRGSGVRVYLCKTPRTHHAPTLAPHARILAHPHPLPNACTSAPALLYARAGPRACAPAPTGTHHPTPRAQAHISQPPRPKCARQPYYAPEDTTNALSAAPGSEMYKHNEHALRCAPKIHAGHIEDTLLGQSWLTSRCVCFLVVPPPIYDGCCGNLTRLGWVVSLGPLSKSDTLLLTMNTEVHIAPKLRNSASTASKAPTCDLQAVKRALVSICAYKVPSTILRVLPVSVHNIGISADHNAYTRPELLAFTLHATFQSRLAHPL
ncbi:hypothetical protein FIBSPDRAFT_959999 [Athelia psychrophila]|uniref:Uncharacterized protein n=1 Tax=Athelia psychrophila TaxID=1759441 RepID=A0A166CVW2_9AGAM|nr:hypothetical protein FIBSPDRAFT_959999 [Fibularhizoctonia sp. CBS 109695]